MELRRLTYFIRVAEDGSLSKAAGILRIAQPALSRQMRLLEEELGVALFHRMPRGMRLTEAGEALRQSVAAPLREIELALQHIRSQPAASEGSVVIGMPASVAHVLAAILAKVIAQVLPGIRCTIVEGPMGSLIDWLSRGVVDFALIEETSGNAQLAEQKLGSLPLALFGPADSALPPGVPVPFAEAAQLPLVLNSHHLGIRSAINDAAARTRARLNLRMEAESARLIGEMLEGGMGYTMLPRCYMAGSALQSWELCNPTPTITVLLASRRNSQISTHRAGAVEAVIAEVARELLN
jgi:DNA-binding transcriptional LysR family regulator